jgi:hypothetical protein
MALQGVALGALQTTSATLNGAIASRRRRVACSRQTSRRSCPPRTNWEGTQWRFGAGFPNCANTEDQHSNGTESVNFNVTAPGTPARTTPALRRASATTAAEHRRGDRPPSGGAGHRAGAEPNLTPRCGINVMLVLDESGSISSSIATKQVRNAAGRSSTGSPAPARRSRSSTSATPLSARARTRR